MRYIDTGNRHESQAVATWLRMLSAEHVSALRIQSGYFTAEPLGLLTPLADRLAAVGGILRIVLGSNDSDTSVEDVIALLRWAGPRREGVQIGVAALSGGLFHPKVIHIEAGDRRIAFVGSANFTGSGMTGQNVEAGVLCDTDEGDPAEMLKGIADSIDSWFTRPEGLLIVDSEERARELVAAGVLCIESDRPGRSPRSSASSGPRPSSRLRVNRLVRLPETLSQQTAEAPNSSQSQGSEDDPSEAEGATWVLVWRSTGLTRRDLNIPTADRTNATGSMGLKRGDWHEEIDHRHYFRESVFAALEWIPEAGTTRETAVAPVELWVHGAKVAESSVVIAHNFDTASKTYLQRNFVTSLRWGDLRPLIAAEEYLGQVLLIERAVGGAGDGRRFRLSVVEEA